MAYHFEFELTVSDYEEYNVHITKKSYRQSRNYRFIVAGAILLWALFLFYQSNFELSPPIIFLPLISVYIFLVPLILGRTARKNMRSILAKARPGSIIGPTKLTITEKSVHSEGTLIDSTILWGAVQDVETHSKYVFIYLTAHSAIIVPRNIIGNDAAVSEFATFVRAQIDRSYNKEEIAQHLV